MAEQKNQQAQPELSLSEQTRIRREKLATLQAEGENPFAVTRFDWDATSHQIKDNFDAMEGKAVKVAGRLMSKRGMGKVSFCDLRTGTAASSSMPGRTRWTKPFTRSSRSTTSAILLVLRARYSAPSGAR